MSKWMLMISLLAAPLSAIGADPGTLSCEAMTKGDRENNEESLKILAREIPSSSAKFLTDGIRKELLKKGVNEYGAFSASLDYYARTALPIADEVTAQFALIAEQEGSYINGVKRYCKDKSMTVPDFFRRAFDAAVDDKLEEARS